MQQVVYLQLNLVDFLEKSLPVKGRRDKEEKGIKTLVEEPENSTAPLREIHRSDQISCSVVSDSLRPH